MWDQLVSDKLVVAASQESKERGAWAGLVGGGVAGGRGFSVVYLHIALVALVKLAQCLLSADVKMKETTQK